MHFHFLTINMGARLACISVVGEHEDHINTNASEREGLEIRRLG